MDKNEVSLRIDYINEKLVWLKKSLDKYDKSVDDKDDSYLALKAVERDCEEIVESAVRVNQEILSDLGDVGETYRDSFDKLSSLKLFDKKNLDRLANTVGFRNRLAHDYMDLDEDLTIRSAKGILNLYPKYLVRIVEYIESSDKSKEKS